ncbi:ROK family protein [Aliiglaciecola sp. LCG003]|uniref:ROK family protein n=1 Tax=Aliiglaciecola sp. LCG003 TaxID=3053655 RepID=UPI0025745F21|nr:ROK family protein [Aliiglaciecola sp. LCG003]WJG09821.1 ROK family protein [Aliiglaciecola sp. LCG003]
MNNPIYYAVVEGGGTKFNCAIVDEQRNIHVSHRISTTTPQETIALVCDFFIQQRDLGFTFEKLGLACFGPLDLNRGSKTFGCITATPKPNWSHYFIVEHIKTELNCHVELETDVNAAALAEYRWGASQNTSVSIYITIGTGLGGGVIINGKPLHGLIHPEIGHTLIPPPEGIEGVCPFHGNCVEGLASGTAMSKIWQQPAETLADDHIAWDIQAQVIAKLCHNLFVNFSPERIILGGGVMNKPNLLEKVRDYTEVSLADYLALPEGVRLEDLMSMPGLGENSGLFGALALVLQE